MKVSPIFISIQIVACVASYQKTQAMVKNGDTDYGVLKFIIFHKESLLRRSLIKKVKKSMGDLICYCFGYTSADIKQDFLDNGQSLILKKIMVEKKIGECDCSTKNPKGK